MREIDSDTKALLASKFEHADQLPKHELKTQIFRYAKPEMNGRPRAITRLFTSDLMSGLVQYIHKGGETTLHSHAGMDGMWMVLSGRARFYGDGDELIGEFGPLEGVYIPRDVKYWFESASEDEPLQLLQVEAFVRDRKNVYRNFSRVSEADQAERSKAIQFFDAKEPV
jgi:mannose-6-phosphate isomerase-like protein (cupin superfamily)